MKKLEFVYYDWKEFAIFLDSLSDKDAAKLAKTIQKIEAKGLLVATRQKWVKKLDTDLYEIRSKQGSDIQRAIYFQIRGDQYMITHGFSKKTQKTPEKEKKLAENRRQKFWKERHKYEQNR